MPLPAFLERFRRGSPGAGAPASDGRAPSASDVEALRIRARRRLIGMAVLVGAGVLCFPWLFETQPRPMSPDIRIVPTAPQAGGADVSARAVSGRVAVSAPAAGARVAPAPLPSPALEGEREGVSAPEKVVADEGAEKSVAKPVRKPAEKPAEKSVEKPPAKAAVKPDTKPDTKVATRYVVQFGAFADANAARETRQKAERLGLKTYAQQVDTPAGKRVRVRLGPFSDRAEAEKALATLRKGGLTGAILTL